MEKLPKTIVIPGQLVIYCVLQVIEELWEDENVFSRDFERCESIGVSGPSGLQKREATASMRVALAEPWWRRREVVEREWSRNARAVNAWRLETIVLRAEENPHVRVPVRFAAVLLREEDVLPATPTEQQLAEAQALTRSLTRTPAYCQWIAAGGDADFGRWLAIFWLDDDAQTMAEM